MKRANPIPTEHKAAVYFLGLNPEEIVEVKEISPSRWAVKLAKGELEWSGQLTAPAWSIRPPVTTIEDLLNETTNCPHCSGSGKVPREGSRIGDC